MTRPLWLATGARVIRREGQQKITGTVRRIFSAKLREPARVEVVQDDGAVSRLYCSDWQPEDFTALYQGPV